MSGARNDRGVALLLVLWVFMTLGVLALDFSQYMHDDALAAINFADETRGYYAALAAMNHVLYDAVRAKEGTGNAATPNAAPDLGRHLAEDQDQEEAALPADGQWHDGTFQGIAYKVRMTDQGGLIPINRPDEALLRRVITNLVRGGNSTTGIDRRTQTDIDTVVDSILDWRDRDHLRRAHGAESQFYLKRNGYPAKDGLFDSPEELLLVRGVTAELFYGAPGRPGLRDVISIYTNRGGTTGSDKMNVRYMPTAVMQVLLGIDPDAAEQLGAQRDADPVAFLPVLQAQAIAVDPHLIELLDQYDPRVVMLEGRADTHNARNQSWVAAVVDLTAENTEGPKVLRWFDRAPWSGMLPTVPARAEAG